MSDKLIIDNLIDELFEPYKEVHFGLVKFIRINPVVISLAQPYGVFHHIYFKRNIAIIRTIFGQREIDLSDPDSIQTIKEWIKNAHTAYKNYHEIANL